MTADVYIFIISFGEGKVNNKKGKIRNAEGKTVAPLTLGCKVNQYETDGMIELLKEAGMTAVSFEEKADVYLINTCSVTNMADKKSRQMIHRAKKLNPDAVVIAAGCYVQAAKDKLMEDDRISIIIGNNKRRTLCRSLKTIWRSE